MRRLALVGLLALASVACSREARINTAFAVGVASATGTAACALSQPKETTLRVAMAHRGCVLLGVGVGIGSAVVLRSELLPDEPAKE